MIAYVDSSVLLRVALGQASALPEWQQIDRGVSSALISTESFRTLDRLRIRRATIYALIDSLELVEVDARVLDRAGQPMPTELGTLGAIHLASALLWKDETGADPVMATHDVPLGLAAQAHGLKVKGVSA